MRDEKIKSTEEEKKGEYEFYDRRENNVWERIIFPEKEEIYRIERKVLFEMYLEFPSFMNVLEEMKSTVREEEWSYMREKIIFSLESQRFQRNKLIERMKILIFANIFLEQLNTNALLSTLLLEINSHVAERRLVKLEIK